MNLDQFFNKTYHNKDYTCANFVVDVWKLIDDFDLTSALLGPATKQPGNVLHRQSLVRLAGPCNPCVALFTSPGKASHVGIMLDGKLLHLSDNGVTWVEIERFSYQFKKVRFYSVKKVNNN